MYVGAEQFDHPSALMIGASLQPRAVVSRVLGFERANPAKQILDFVAVLVDLGSHDPHDARVAAGNLADFGHQGFDLCAQRCQANSRGQKTAARRTNIVTSTPAHVATAVASISANSMCQRPF